jgi:predicted AAA+ superfamily ATPase
MDVHPRYLSQCIREDLEFKMVFIGGRRQVGKTTLSLEFLDDHSISNQGYLNWDNPTIRRDLINGILPDSKIIVLNEIHKYKMWRNLVKGFYDTKKDKQKFIITGSARLDYFKNGGDSMQGRYHYYRLHPYSLLELSSKPNQEDIKHLFNFGGFPEPLFRNDMRHLRRWQNERIQRVLNDDVRDLSSIKDISLLGLLIEELPLKIGSPLYVQKLSFALQVSHPTVTNWLEILDAMYVSFRVAPYGSSKIRAVKKEQKLYLWDWSVVQDPGARFENMVASQLLKYCHFLYDYQGYKMELRYISDTDGREIDFVVLQDGQPLFAVECKLHDTSISPNIKYFTERTEIKKFYQVHMGNKSYIDTNTNCHVLPFDQFCIDSGMI